MARDEQLKERWEDITFRLEEMESDLFEIDYGTAKTW